MIQLELFNQPTLNVSKQFKTALAADIKKSGMSREQIVDRMNDLAERHGVSLAHGNASRLTIETFEKWLNPADLGRLMPVKALPVFCAATGQCAAFCAVAEPMGLQVIGAREQKMLAWAEAKLAVKAKSRKIRELEADL
jgi:hypothetical protein